MTLFHEQMHGVAKILGDAARGGNAGAAELARALAAKYGAPLAPGEAFNEEAFADAFRDFVAGKIDVAEEERGLFGRFVDFVRSLFARAEEAARERTLMDEFFEQAAAGRAVEAVAADDAAHHAEGAEGASRSSIGTRDGMPSAEEVAEARRQYDAVVARYTNPDGTRKPGWMKAPNGAPTRLTERQWVQVRTENFKRWFGDWEAAAELSGSDLVSAKAAFKSLMRDHAEITTSDGATLRFVSQSAKAYSKEAEHESSNRSAHWCAIANIETLVSRAVALYEESPRNGSADIDAYVKYGAVFTLGGRQYLAKITSKRYANRTAQNFYSVESVSVEEITGRGIHGAIGKGQPLDAASEARIAELLARGNPSSVSKVVDENGEPLVVWHGSHWDPLAEEPGKAVFRDAYRGTGSGDSGFFGRGFYFSFTEDEAQTYGRRTGGYFLNLRNPFVFIDEMDFIDGLRTFDMAGSDVAPIVNLSDKFPDTASEFAVTGWTFDANGDGTPTELSLHDFAKEIRDILAEPKIRERRDPITEALSEFQKRHGFGSVDIPRITEVSQEPEFTDELKKKGHDGVLQSKDGDEAVAFTPTQVKSATDNAGTFGGERGDIRASIGSRSGVTPEEDAAYMDAVRRGDMETAQRMVDEADKQNGYTVDVYHGTQHPGFFKFKDDETGGVFVSNKVETSQTYVQEVFGDYGGIDVLPVIEKFGSRPDMVRKAKASGRPGIYHLALRPGRTLTVDAHGKRWNELSEADGLPEEIRPIAPRLHQLIAVRSYDDNGNRRILLRADENEKDLNDESYPSVLREYGKFRGWTKDEVESYQPEFVTENDYSTGKEEVISFNYSMPFSGISELNAFLQRLSPFYKVTEEDFDFETDEYGDKTEVPEGESSSRHLPPKAASIINTRRVAAFAEANGYDSVHFQNVVDNGASGDAGASDVWWVRKSSQLKMRNPVTYDDAGNVIPLSQRFDPRKDDVRYSIGTRDGADLANRENYAAFKDAMSVEHPLPGGVELLPEDVSPKEALDYFENNILGRTITMPDGETISLNAGHFFRLVCDGDHGKKGFVAGFDSAQAALDAIRRGQVKPEDINGYHADRARMLPVFIDTVERPAFILEDKRDSAKQQFVKRYRADGGRGVTAAFRFIKDGRKIQSYHGFSTRYGLIKQNRIVYSDNAVERGASPDATERARDPQVASIEPQGGAAVNGESAPRSSIGPRDGDGSTPPLSRMDLAVAFAARDAMTGRNRSDEDYARLIKGLGVGAMYTPDELRRAGRAAAATERMRGEGKAGTKAWRAEMRTPSLRALARNARAQRMLEEAIRSAYRFGERAGARAGAKAGTAEAEARRRGEEAARRMLAKMMRSAQGLDVRELDAILGVPAPAHLLRAGATNATERAIVDALAAVLADTRSHMPEAARLSDLELAALYLAQMTKDASTLAAAAPSNTIEYLIGAGIRADIAR